MYVRSWEIPVLHSHPPSWPLKSDPWSQISLTNKWDIVKSGYRGVEMSYHWLVLDLLCCEVYNFSARWVLWSDNIFLCCHGNLFCCCNGISFCFSCFFNCFSCCLGQLSCCKQLHLIITKIHVYIPLPEMEVMRFTSCLFKRKDITVSIKIGKLNAMLFQVRQKHWICSGNIECHKFKLLALYFWTKS